MVSFAPSRQNGTSPLPATKFGAPGARARLSGLPRVRRPAGDNAISDEGAATLAAALDQNASLQTLRIESNQIRGAGASAFADSISRTKLQMLAIGSRKSADGRRVGSLNDV